MTRKNWKNAAARLSALAVMCTWAHAASAQESATASKPKGDDLELDEVVVTARMVKDSALVPFLMVGGTDNRFFRRAGSVGYGFALFSKRLAYEDFASMFHGNDERVDAESLGLTEQLWRAVAEEMLT